ncbi:MAG: hypothetical protein ATN35_04100 [Epulopiscium sp. Nele67-Bin004]|nr:MAG: hypothetical protein ATN35_04100 [Epulopiscium sp. Nele67-Bin004]
MGKMDLIVTVLLISFLLMRTDIQASILQEDNIYHQIVNTDNILLADYVPPNLVKPNVLFYNQGNLEQNYIEQEAAIALEKMFNSAKQEGITLVAVSGYRSYARQLMLYNNAISNHGIDYKGVAIPGASEHQIGLTMDIVGVSGHLLQQSFDTTPEWEWLAQNAHLFGYIMRYPADKEHVTGIIYEPWHFRYVGEELATYCYTNNLALEEVKDFEAKDFYFNELFQKLVTSLNIVNYNSSPFYNIDIEYTSIKFTNSGLQSYVFRV